MPPGGFEHGTPGSEIHRLNQFVDELLEYGAERVKSRPVLILNLFQIHGPLAYLLKTSDGTSGLGKKKMQAMWLSHVTHKSLNVFDQFVGWRLNGSQLSKNSIKNTEGIP